MCQIQAGLGARFELHRTAERRRGLFPSAERGLRHAEMVVELGVHRRQVGGAPKEVGGKFILPRLMGQHAQRVQGIGLIGNLPEHVTIKRIGLRPTPVLSVAQDQIERLLNGDFGHCSQLCDESSLVRSSRCLANLNDRDERSVGHGKSRCRSIDGQRRQRRRTSHDAARLSTSLQLRKTRDHLSSLDSKDFGMIIEANGIIAPHWHDRSDFFHDAALNLDSA